PRKPHLHDGNCRQFLNQFRTGRKAGNVLFFELWPKGRLSQYSEENSNSAQGSCCASQIFPATIARVGSAETPRPSSRRKRTHRKLGTVSQTGCSRKTRPRKTVKTSSS